MRRNEILSLMRDGHEPEDIVETMQKIQTLRSAYVAGMTDGMQIVTDYNEKINDLSDEEFQEFVDTEIMDEVNSGFEEWAMDQLDEGT